MRSFVCFLLIVLFTSSFSVTAQPKGYLYDESKVAPYELPDPMVCLDGTKVTDSKTWLKKRRPEVLRLFEEKSMDAPRKTERDALRGSRGRRRSPRREGNAQAGTVIHLGKGKKALAVNLLLYLPQKAKGPVPGFLTINFMGNHSVHADPAIRIPNSWVRNGTGVKNNKQPPMAGVPGPRVGQLMRLLSVVMPLPPFITEISIRIFTTDMKMDSFALLPERPQKRKPTDWASIAGWAWGLSRCLDYLETDSVVDAARIAVMGHSRLGKTSLWAGATDERFALVISNNSGCGGAALSRRKFGETVKRSTPPSPIGFATTTRNTTTRKMNALWISIC